MPTATADPAANCRTAAEVEAVLKAFARAFNAGEQMELDAVLSPQFEWYSATIPARGHTVSYGKGSAMTFFQERHRAGDRIEFRRASVNALEAWDGAAHFAPVFVLTGVDGRYELEGKGVVYCTGARRGVKVLSLYIP